MKRIVRGGGYHGEDLEETAVEWVDNKHVKFYSTLPGVDGVGECKRWSASEKKRTSVPQPTIGKLYNETMHAVDLANQHRKQHRIELKRLRKWTVRFFLFLLNISLVNAYSLYLFGKENAVSERDFQMLLCKQLLHEANVLAEDSLRKKRKLHSKETASVLSKTASVLRSVESPSPHEMTFLPNDKRVRCSLGKQCANKHGHGSARCSAFCSSCKKAFCRNPCYMRYHFALFNDHTPKKNSFEDSACQSLVSSMPEVHDLVPLMTPAAQQLAPRRLNDDFIGNIPAIDGADSVVPQVPDLSEIVADLPMEMEDPFDLDL